MPDRVGFTRLEPFTTGIQFTNRLSENRSLTNQIYLNGSGVAAGDVDGDGWCDLYFCGLDRGNALYRNLGNWRFEDITDRAGVACADLASTGAALVDLDGDGALDLLVNAVGAGTRLFLGDGRGRFRDATGGSGLEARTGSASFAFGDVDGDGRLDVYVVNYRSDTLRDMPGLAFTVGVTNGARRLLTVDGRSAEGPEWTGRFTFGPANGILENGEPDVLYRNLGGGRFERVPWGSAAFLDERGQPMPAPHDWGLSAMFRDLNGDRAPDLYVCNDFQSPDRIWINEGRGTFRAAPAAMFRQTSLFSMGVDFADIDRDGDDDVFVADMLSREHVRRQVQVMGGAAARQSRTTGDERPQHPRNTLFLNRGEGTFAEIAQLAGIDASDWTWCPAFLDVDLDGFEDLLVTTGHWRDAQDADAAREVEMENERQRRWPREQLRARRRFPKLETPNFAFRNRGDATFEEVGASWGFDSTRVSQGLALADLDLDGDLDVVVTCLNDGPLLLRNDTVRPRVAVRLRGVAPNTRGIGSRLVVRAPGLPVQSQEVIAGGRYVSSDDPLRVFAAGSTNDRVTIEVTWRSGRRSIITDAPANHAYEVAEGESEQRVEAAVATAHETFFEDRSRLLNHRHIDEPFDDFSIQPLLPHAISQSGPAVVWFDFNGDRWEDLLVGAGKGGRLAVFRNDGQGGFIPQRSQVFQMPFDRELTGLLGWRSGGSALGLLMGADPYETAATNQPTLRQLSLVTGQFEVLPVPDAPPIGPLALGDVDGDGDLDLFVGARARLGRFPEAARSSLLRNEGGKWTADDRWSVAIGSLGVPNGATFTDVHGDRRPELVVACEWGPLRVLREEGGRVVTWDPPLRWSARTLAKAPSRLSECTGWWNSVAAADFDGDGRMDLVAGNWGRNTARQWRLAHPIRMRIADPGETGRWGLLEAGFDPTLAKYVPLRDRSALAPNFPAFEARYPTFATFSRAGVDDLLALEGVATREVEAASLDSMVFLNRGDVLEAHALPMEAQISPVFGIAVGDLDGDGSVDLFLAQNHFGTHPAESPHDAGLGAWLKGDGRGRFQAVPAAESGIRIEGDGRGAAACDFDHDGRLDLVVTQHRGETTLLRNVQGRPGLRVVLRGDGENPQGIGAVVRAAHADGRLGPAHEVRLGSGYWTQESPTVVLSGDADVVAVVVDWPRAGVHRVPVPTEDFEIEISSPAGGK